MASCHNQPKKKIKVLFVCLGNICRSPMAAYVFTHMAKQKGVEDCWCVHSAGLGDWHVGSNGDGRMLMTLKKYQVPAKHVVRQIRESDYHEFDLILGMDHENVKALEKKKPPQSKADIKLFGDYDPLGEKVIRDPYYDTDLAGFEKCYEQCVRCSEYMIAAAHYC